MMKAYAITVLVILPWLCDAQKRLEQIACNNPVKSEKEPRIHVIAVFPEDSGTISAQRFGFLNLHLQCALEEHFHEVQYDVWRPSESACDKYTSKDAVSNILKSNKVVGGSRDSTLCSLLQSAAKCINGYTADEKLHIVIGLNLHDEVGKCEINEVLPLKNFHVTVFWIHHYDLLPRVHYEYVDYAVIDSSQEINQRDEHWLPSQHTLDNFFIAQRDAGEGNPLLKYLFARILRLYKKITGHVFVPQVPAASPEVHIMGDYGGVLSGSNTSRVLNDKASKLLKRGAVDDSYAALNGVSSTSMSLSTSTSESSTSEPTSTPTSTSTTTTTSTEVASTILESPSTSNEPPHTSPISHEKTDWKMIVFIIFVLIIIAFGVAFFVCMYWPKFYHDEPHSRMKKTKKSEPDAIAIISNTGVAVPADKKRNNSTESGEKLPLLAISNKTTSKEKMKSSNDVTKPAASASVSKPSLVKSSPQKSQKHQLPKFTPNLSKISEGRESPPSSLLRGVETCPIVDMGPTSPGGITPAPSVTSALEDPKLKFNDGKIPSDTVVELHPPV